MQFLGKYKEVPYFSILELNQPRNWRLLFLHRGNMTKAVAIHTSFMATLPTASSSKQEQLLLEVRAEGGCPPQPMGSAYCRAVVLRNSKQSC